MNLLIIDDDPLFRTLISVFAERLGIKCLELPNGLGALLTLTENNVDMVLLDILMDEQEGLQTLTEIKTYFNVPVVMVSSDEHYLDTASNLGADAVVRKPVTYEAFVEIINKYGQGKDRLNLRSEESGL